MFQREARHGVQMNHFYNEPAIATVTGRSKNYSRVARVRAAPEQEKKNVISAFTNLDQES